MFLLAGNIHLLWMSTVLYGAGDGTVGDSLALMTISIELHLFRFFAGDQAQDPCQPSAYLKHIIAISAGRSGEFSLAVDANGYAYGWGYDKYGQCGNDESGNFVKDFA